MHRIHLVLDIRGEVWRVGTETILNICVQFCVDAWGRTEWIWPHIFLSQRLGFWLCFLFRHDCFDTVLTFPLWDVFAIVSLKLINILVDQLSSCLVRGKRSKGRLFQAQILLKSILRDFRLESTLRKKIGTPKIVSRKKNLSGSHTAKMSFWILPFYHTLRKKGCPVTSLVTSDFFSTARTYAQYLQYIP